MEEEGEHAAGPSVVKSPAAAKIPMRIDNFLQNRELSNNKRVVRTFNADFAKNDFCQKDVREHTGCINSVQFSRGEQLLATGGDDLHSRIWRVDDLMLQKNPKPIMRATESHFSNIFSLEFDLEERNIFSGERRGCILKHDIETSQSVYGTDHQRRRGEVYALHHHPFDAHVLLVTHAHSISILDDRDRGRQTSLVTTDFHRREFYSAEFHPISPVLMLINGILDGPLIYDRRNPRVPIFEKSVFTGLPNSADKWMGASWSPSGNQYMAVRRSATPLYFDLITKRCFDLKSADSPIGYCNGKTIKSMTFIDDYTVATGSDHWGIHIWKCPRADDTCGFVRIDDEYVHDVSQLFVEKELRVLRGHRSIPNQIRFSRKNQILVSSGVENSFKLWSHCRLPWSYDIPFERNKIGTYDSTPEEELNREKEERRILEDELDRDGLMEGRACWNDVFGGDQTTSEDRETLEMFDTLVGRDEPEDDSDDEEDGGMEIFQFHNEEGRNVFARHANMNRELDAMLRGGEDVRQFANRLRRHLQGGEFALLRRRRNRRRGDSSSDSDDDNFDFGAFFIDSDDDDNDEQEGAEAEDGNQGYVDPAWRVLEMEQAYAELEDEEEEGDEEMEEEEQEEDIDDDEDVEGIDYDDLPLAEVSDSEGADEDYDGEVSDGEEANENDDSGEESSEESDEDDDAEDEDDSD